MLLLHGLGGDSSNWQPTIAPLAKHFRVIVPDQVGFGRSDKPMINYRVGTLVDFLNGLYRELGISKASLVGNSLGGWTAAAFALAYPEKVARLVLVDAAGFALEGDVDPRVLNGLNASTRESARAILSMIFYNKAVFASDVAVDALFTRKMTVNDGYTVQRFIDSFVQGHDMLDGRLGELKHPTLIVWGREDLLTPLAMGERFKREIKDSKLLVLEQCGHVPQIEKPGEFNTAVLEFLSAESQARR